MKTNWTRDELKAYILFFCANADYVETEEEIEFIKSKISIDVFNHMHKEFNADNDFQIIQKIQTTIKDLNYSKKDIDSLLDDIMSLFLSDGKFDLLEENLYREIKHVIY